MCRGRIPAAKHCRHVTAFGKELGHICFNQLGLYLSWMDNGADFGWGTKFIECTC
jgi:hypothetical protein